jgi:anti-sigma factor RsiW
MTCRELTDFLCAYLLGRLPEPQIETFETHLRECPACVAFLNDIGAVARLGRCAKAGPEFEVDEDVPVPLLQAVRAAQWTSAGA